MSGARRTIEVVNQRGLHARASAKFVNAVAELPEGCSVRVAKGDNAPVLVVQILLERSENPLHIAVLCTPQRPQSVPRTFPPGQLHRTAPPSPCCVP